MAGALNLARKSEFSRVFPLLYLSLDGAFRGAGFLQNKLTNLTPNPNFTAGNPLPGSVSSEELRGALETAGSLAPSLAAPFLEHLGASGHACETLSVSLSASSDNL